jgi:phage tail-like protein
MTMATANRAERRFAPIAGAYAWSRCRHQATTVDASVGVVSLQGEPSEPGDEWPDPPSDPAERAGIAFDGRCHAYRGVPHRGQIERTAWPRRARGLDDAPVELLAEPLIPPAEGGVSFRPVDAQPGRPLRARAMAVDPDEHLFVLDGATGTVAILDLADGHLLRTVALAWRPVDLASRDPSVLVATSSREHPLVQLDAIGVPLRWPIDTGPHGPLAGVPHRARPRRVAVGPDGAVWLLLRDAIDGWIVRVTGERLAQPIRVRGAEDLEIDGSGLLVVAGPAGYHLKLWTLSGQVVEPGIALKSPAYDGRGIARTPEGRIAFGTRRGIRVARPQRVRYPQVGHLDTYRMDSGNYRRQWGRVFIEACVPPGTTVEVGFATTDDLPAFGPAETTAPDSPDSSYPPPASVVQLKQCHPLHRRETGRELAWTPLARNDRFEVYEAPVLAPPGRYLWLRLRLRGTSTLTPRIRAVRVECEAHDLLSRLPRLYRTDPVSAAFLQRYLAIADGLLHEIEARALQRDLLFDPYGAPAELLPWLASLIGLTSDQRWPEPARRTVLAEAICLFRRRGTIAGLRRLLEIYLRAPVVVMEAFRLRGSDGAFVGGDEAEPGPASAVVGTRLQVGGELGTSDPAGGGRPPADGFATHAHRFSVLVTRDLCEDELAVVADLLELHRPAHTVVEFCGAGAGLRVGINLYLELSTVVGPGSSFSAAVVGRDVLGGGAVLGHGRAGIRPGSARLGEDTEID